MAEGRSHGWFLYSEKCPRGGALVNYSDATLDMLTAGKWIIMELPSAGRVAAKLVTDVREQDGYRAATIQVVDADSIQMALDTSMTLRLAVTDTLYMRVFDPSLSPVNWTEEQWKVNIAKAIDTFLRQRQNCTAPNSLIEKWLIEFKLLPEHLSPPTDKKMDAKAVTRKRKAYLRSIYRQWDHMFTSSGGRVNHSLRPSWEIDHIRTEFDADTQVSRSMHDQDDRRIRINWWMLAQGLMMIIRAFSCFHLVDDQRTPPLPTDQTLEDRIRSKGRIRRDN